MNRTTTAPSAALPVAALLALCISICAMAESALAESALVESAMANNAMADMSSLKGDPEAGEALTATCVACHGQDGNSPASAFPSIAGQTESYLYKQLREMQTGERPVPTMAGMLDNMTEDDLWDLAAWYASHEPARGAADPELVELGEAIYRTGIKRKQIAACTACHSPTGQGNDPAGFPALAGQWPEYTIQQLKAFRSGERHNDGDTRMMRLTAEDMSDREIEAVAAYLHGLGN